MIAFEFNAILSDPDRRPIRPVSIAVSAPRLRDDGRYACCIECSEPGISRHVVSTYSELAYNRALNRLRYTLFERDQWLTDAGRRWLWLDPPRLYRVPHQGFRWPDRGIRRLAFPRVSFVGALLSRDGHRRPFSVRIGYPRPDHRLPYHRCSLFYTEGVVKFRFWGTWIDEAYSYAFRAARQEVDFQREHGFGEFVDAEDKPIKVTAPLVPDGNAEAIQP